jgi:hypothetical protein
MNKQRITYPQVDRWSYLWLFLGMLLGLVSISIGKWVFPAAVWPGSIFVLRFMRTQRRVWLGYLILVVTTAIVAAIALPAFLGPLLIGIVIGSAVVTNLAPLVDRLLVPRLGGFVATLVFPLAYTTIEFVNTLTNP